MFNYVFQASVDEKMKNFLYKRAENQALLMNLAEKNIEVYRNG